MPRYSLQGAPERAHRCSETSFGLSDIERGYVGGLVGHSLALIEREFILQTLQYNQGNRTHAASLLGISIRSLRDRICNYKTQGQCVPDPRSRCLPGHA